MEDTVMYAVAIKNLNWFFSEKEILQDINLNIEKNKFYSIIGPNGSGKTTLLKNISKSLEPQINTVFINNHDLVRLKNKEIAKRIACVPQNTHIDFSFSAMDIVLMGRSPYFKRFQSEGEKDISIVKKAMMVTNTWHLKDKNINEVSGGEKQRVIIARALAQEAGIVLLDEPVSQLDIHHQIELMDTLHKLILSSGITVLTVMHDLNLAAQYSDCIILLNEGKVVSQGPPENVITQSNIESVYNLKVHIIEDPVTGKPHVIPIGGQS